MEGHPGEVGQEEAGARDRNRASPAEQVPKGETHRTTEHLTWSLQLLPLTWPAPGQAPPQQAPPNVRAHSGEYPGWAGPR